MTQHQVIELLPADALDSTEGPPVASRVVQVLQGRWFLGTAGALIFLGIWELGHLMTPVEGQRFLPSPIRVIYVLYDLLAHKGFIYDIAKSVQRIFVSFFLACAIAVPLGIAMGSSPFFRNLLGPIFSAARYLPAASFVPLLLVWFGPTDIQKLALLVLGVVFFLVALIQDNAAAVPQDLIESARTMGASNRRTIREVIIPSAAPTIFDSMRNMIAVSWTYLVIAEIVAASDGIGAVMMRAGRFLNVDIIMAGILTIGILGVATDLLFKGAAFLIFPWMNVRKG